MAPAEDLLGLGGRDERRAVRKLAVDGDVREEALSQRPGGCRYEGFRGGSDTWARAGEGAAAT